VGESRGVGLRTRLEEGVTMLRNRRSRRLVAALLLVLGALLMLFSPSVEAGLVAFALGVALELAGLAIERSDRR
jgi:uncharacterized membrane protein HdeD (DUF308 family)